MCYPSFSVALVAGMWVNAATAQGPTGGWDIRVSNVVSPSQPSATIEIWAWMEPQSNPQLAFCCGDFDFVADSGRPTNPRVDPWFTAWPFYRSGVEQGSGVVGVVIAQLPPPFQRLNGDIRVWLVDWDTDDFTPRRVHLRTAGTTGFGIYEQPFPSSMVTDLYPHAFFPGEAWIRVVPAPTAGMVLLVAGIGVWMPRRRSTSN